MMICGAKTRSGTPCKQKAGWGTHHVGEGKCKLHGGASHGRPIVHGRYAKVFKGKLREKFEEAYSDGNPLDLLPELAVQRTLLQNYIDRFVESYSPSGPDLKVLSALSNDVVNTATKIINTRNQTALTVAEIKYLQMGIVALLDEFIPDPDRRRSFITRLMAIIPQSAVASGAELAGMDVPQISGERGQVTDE